MKTLESFAVKRQSENSSVQESSSGNTRPLIAPLMKQPKFRRLFDRHAGIFIS